MRIEGQIIYKNLEIPEEGLKFTLPASTGCACTGTDPEQIPLILHEGNEYFVAIIGKDSKRVRGKINLLLEPF